MVAITTGFPDSISST
ncbi:hypothetical protein D030_3070A, partial [Vibrio parahaemolyticus AQ3810]